MYSVADEYNDAVIGQEEGDDDDDDNYGDDDGEEIYSDGDDADGSDLPSPFDTTPVFVRRSPISLSCSYL